MPYNFFNAVTDLEDDCRNNNAGDLCAIDACLIEGTFTLTFFPQFFGGLQYDEQYRALGSYGFKVEVTSF